MWKWGGALKFRGCHLGPSRPVSRCTDVNFSGYYEIPVNIVATKADKIPCKVEQGESAIKRNFNFDPSDLTLHLQRQAWDAHENCEGKKWQKTIHATDAQKAIGLTAFKENVEFCLLVSSPISWNWRNCKETIQEHSTSLKISALFLAEADWLCQNNLLLSWYEWLCLNEVYPPLVTPLKNSVPQPAVEAVM